MLAVVVVVVVVVVWLIGEFWTSFVWENY